MRVWRRFETAKTGVLMRPLSLACLFTCAQALNAFGQTQNAASPTELIQALMSRIEQLEKRVAELETSRATAPAGPLTNGQTPAMQGTRASRNDGRSLRARDI